ncbi:DUF3574 domain-containing protein [Streptomyces triticagri]|uniref:DUF3574 domain-containing protein n=1 Tax=Streptomyces triticagri TaxID=2293568 RepID=A0A372M2U2_9ACTN|nr:DUF3574 domain-containing protein [Streptomyces triticagri]RFU85248.1 DUF3574 domain-containing protein [Streptomyces triticagri]
MHATPTTRSTRTRSARTRAGVLVAGLAVLACTAPTAHASYETTRPAARAVHETARPADGTAYRETRLLFGTERPDGGPDVTERQFTRFVDREVTPYFPEGLTVQEGRGQWRDANGRIERERSYELTLLYPRAEAPERDARIEQVRKRYMQQFGQESVARVDERVVADF